MTNLRSKQKVPDYQQLQLQREREIALNRRLTAIDVIRAHARTHAWTPEEADQVINILGLDGPPASLSGNGWAGFNNG